MPSASTAMPPKIFPSESTGDGRSAVALARALVDQDQFGESGPGLAAGQLDEDVDHSVGRLDLAKRHHRDGDRRVEVDPEMTARVWMSTNSRSTWTSPITPKPMNGFGFWGEGSGPYRDTTAVMKKIKSSVPTKSAK